MPGVVGVLQAYGPWAVGATLVLLAAFFLLRGRVRIEEGWGGFDIARFAAFERAVHWLLALSFLVVAWFALSAPLRGLPWLPQAASDPGLGEVLRAGSMLHGGAVLAFTAGLFLAFLLWVRHSLPHWRDIVWVLKGGGLLGWHAPAGKFNAGQKLLFWTTMLGGVVLSVSGIVLAFPSQAGLFAKLLALPNLAGLQLPAELTPLEERQHAAAWHAAAALALACAVLVHVYLRTIGIQGAFSAMASGRVDANWARQHHSLWAAREISRLEAGTGMPTSADRRAAPAE